jgi:tetratricopeptide (TPR) repeat protein
MEVRKALLGVEHPDKLISIKNLATTYREQGKLSKAEQLYLKAIQNSTAQLGPEHPHTLISRINLAMAYADQGRWPEAFHMQT